MISIVRANLDHVSLLLFLARKTFIESHGNSAPKQDIDDYIEQHYNDAVFHQELSDDANIYHLLYYDDTPVGFSKIILNAPYNESPDSNLAKLERIYLLKDFYQLKLGSNLLCFNIEMAKRHDQKAMWLFVWKENIRAVKFYKKCGFKIIGSHDFRISATHTNPNHQMFLKF